MALQTIYNTNHQNGLLDIVNQMTAADAGLTDTWNNTGNELVIIFNGGGGSITVTDTLPASATLDGIAPTARTHSIAAGKYALLGPYPPAIYNSATGLMTLTWSAVTSVKLLVFLKAS